MFIRVSAASMTLVEDARAGVSRTRTAARTEFAYTPEPGYIYVRSRAISSRTNENYDTFPAEEIEKSWRGFIGKPVFVNHHNADINRARGVIIDAALHKDANPNGTPDTWVEVLMAVDAMQFPKLAQAIVNGDIDRTSMGTAVAYTICSYCSHKAETPLDYCQHVARMKGQRIIRPTTREAVLVSEICYGLGFFENSLLVEAPADPTAYAYDVDTRGVPDLVRAAAKKTATVHPLETRLHCCGRGGYRRSREGAVGDADWESYWHTPEQGAGPVPYLQKGAADYLKAHRLQPDARDYSKVMANRDTSKRISDAYDSMPVHDPNAVAAYQQMAKEVEDQYHHLTHNMGVNVQVVDHDPYKNQRELVADLANNKRLQVLATRQTGHHPVFSDEQNDKFRAVHDAFGHASVGRPFDRNGEEAAWLKHSQMFSPLARRAMTTETRGQNSSLTWNDRFPEQKVGLLPEEFTKTARWLQASLWRPMEATEADLTGAGMQTTAAPRWAPHEHPWFKANPVSSQNIIDHWDRATPEDIEQGRNWYSDAHRVAKAIAGGNSALGAGVLAAYSPQTLWPVNMFNAARAIAGGKAIGGPGSGVMATGAMAKAAQRMIDGEHHSQVLKGPKIQDFAHLIEHGGDADPTQPHAVVDRHALSVAVGHRLPDEISGKAPIATRHYYNHVVQAYKDAADQLSKREGHPIYPHQVQAATWLVRQRENALQDAAEGSAMGKGRGRALENATKQWNDYSTQHNLDLGQGQPAYYKPPAVTGTPPVAASLTKAAHKLGYGEQVSPPEVDTLLPESCPICGNADTWNSNQCMECGYEAPPAPFDSPDLDQAQEADLTQGQPLDPEDNPPPLYVGQRSIPSNTVERNTGMPNTPQRGSLHQRLNAQQKQINDFGGLLQAVARAVGVDRSHITAADVPPQFQKNDSDSDSGSDGGSSDSGPNTDSAEYKAGYADGKAGNDKDGSGADYDAGYAAGKKASDGSDSDSDSGSDGDSDKSASLAERRKQAYLTLKRAEGEGASNESARTPDAKDDPSNIGSVPSSANTNVTPDATTSVDSAPTSTTLTSDDAKSEDVQAVPAGVDTPPSPDQAKIPVEIDAPAPADNSTSFNTGNGVAWSAKGDAKTRIFTAMRLAELRCTAGLESDKQLMVAQRISDSDQPLAVLQVRIAELDEVIGAAKIRQAQVRQAGKAPAGGTNLVPQNRTAERTRPSLGGRQLGAVASTGSISSDELGWISD